MKNRAQKYFFSVLVLLISAVVNGQFPGVPIGVPVGGVGAGVNITSTYPLPYANLAADYRSVYLYKASEFGFSSNPGSKVGLFSIGWDVATAQQSPLRNFTIRLKEVDWNVMPDNPDMSGAIEIYYTPTYVENPGINYHDFKDAFCWDGSKNIAIEVCVTNPETERSLNASVKVSVPFQGDAASWHEWENNGLSMCDTIGGGNGLSYPQRPNTYFRLLPGDKIDLDAVVSNIPEEVLESDSIYSVDFEVQNLSCETVDTLVLAYQWANDSIVLDTVSGINLLPGRSYTHYFSKDILAKPIGFNEFKIWANNKNDLNQSNDTLFKLIWVKDSEFTGLDFNGKEFWGAFMANYNNGPTLKQYLYITSPNGANVEVAFPKLGWQENFSITGKDLYRLEIPKYIQQRLIANDSSEQVKPTSYYVKADKAITVYGMSTQYQSTDAFLAIPKRSLGFEYKIIAPEGTYLPGAVAAGNLLTDAPSEFIVVASENNTSVKIISPVPTANTAAFDTIRVVLDQGDNFLVKSKIEQLLGVSNKSYDLTGVHIIADKRIAVISGAQCALIPGQSKLGCQACDHLIEQTQPLNTLGTRFITTDFEYKPGDDYLRIHNPHNKTVGVNISGDLQQTISLNANEYTDIAFQGGLVVEGDTTLQVVQMCTGGRCLPLSITDPFFTNIISENQWANVFSYSNTAGFNISQHFVSIIKRSAEGRIAIDGNRLNNNLFKQIPGSNYYYAKLPSASGSHRITGDSAFVTYVYGFGYDDSYGYPASGALLAPVNAPPLLVYAFASDSKCYNDSTGKAWVEIIGGTAPFVIQWENGATSDSIFDLAPGKYAVKVIDDYGLSFQDTVQVNAPSKVDFTKNKKDVSCFNGSDATVMYTPSGGTAPYQVLHNGIDANPVNNLKAGAYKISITDANACTVTDSVYITENPPLGFTANTYQPFCPKSNDAAIAIKPFGGAGPYSVFINTINADSLSNLSAGIQKITIEDKLGCQLDSNINITDPSEIDVNYTTTKVACYAKTLGTINATAKGGRGNYIFVLNGDTNNTGVFTNLLANTYTLMVSDLYCQKSVQVKVDSISSPYFTLNTKADRCANANGEAVASAVGGSGNYNFQWDGQASTSIANIINLNAGNHTLVASDGVCFDTLNFYINAIAKPQFNFTSNPETCKANNGSIAISDSIFYKGYSWMLNGIVQTKNSAENLISSTYNITYRDSACSVDTIVMVNEIEKFELVDTNLTYPRCGDSSGSIELIINEGASPVKIKWINRSETTAQINGLPQGLYQAVLSDNLCSDTISINLNNIDGPQIKALTENKKCNINNGEIQIVTTNGTGPITYRWQDFPSNTSSKAFNLDAGIYTVFVSDDNCENRLDIKISERPLFQATFNIKKAHCNIGDGELSLNFKDNIGTVKYAINGSAFINYTQAINLDSGLYKLILSDDICVIDTSFYISEYPRPSISASSIAETCNLNNGSISLAGTSYNGVKQFYFNSLANPSSPTISALDSGTYFVALGDGYCYDSLYVKVQNTAVPTMKVVPISDHCSLQVGKLYVKNLTGVGSLSFNYNGNVYAIGDSIYNVPAGMQYFTLNDDNCTVQDSVVVGNISPPTIVSDSIKNLTCNQQNGLIHLSAAGSENNYSIVWADGSTLWKRENLDVGTYMATISGAYCSVNKSFTLVADPEITAKITELHPAHCNGQKGALLVEYANNKGNVYLDIAGQTFLNPDTIRFLPSGSYSYIIRDDYCSINGAVNIGMGKTLKLTFNKSVDDTCTKSTGEIHVNAINNVGAVYYTLNAVPASNPFLNLNAGNYKIVAGDNFCSDSIALTINQLAAPNGTFSILQKDACQKSIAKAAYISNSSNLNFLWDGIAGSSIKDSLAEGKHQLLVSNAYCTDTVNFDIESHQKFVVNTVIKNDQCTQGKGTILISASGTTSPYNVSVNNFNQPLPYKDTALFKGNYTYKISDVYGCEQTLKANVKNEFIALNNGNIWTTPSEIIVGDSVMLDFWLEKNWRFDYWEIDGTIDSNINAYTSFGSLYDEQLIELFALHKDGCKGIIRQKFNPTVDGILYAPNAFTPNGDGENDLFFVKGQNIKTLNGTIYSRWGEKMITFNNPKDTWDGVYKGSLAQIGVYNYRFIVEFMSGFKKEYFGSIRLIR